MVPIVTSWKAAKAIINYNELHPNRIIDTNINVNGSSVSNVLSSVPLNAHCLVLARDPDTALWIPTQASEGGAPPILVIFMIYSFKCMNAETLVRHGTFSQNII